jgi:hypothetical protein
MSTTPLIELANESIGENQKLKKIIKQKDLDRKIEEDQMK